MNNWVRVEQGDCREVVPRLVTEGIQVDAIVTDPPYHLTSTLKRFGNINIDDDTKTSQRLRQKLDGAARLAHGFMNQQWDGGDVAFLPETWATIAGVLRPGGLMLAFGGTRTAHRMVCAIEDAGFVIQDTIAWMYGSGFPKRRDLLKPAFEPICVAYQPGGARTLQVDECQIKPNGGNVTAHPAGRWPANVIHDGSDEVMEAFAKFGERHSARGGGGASGNGKSIFGTGKAAGPPGIFPVYWDNGTAARFFYCAKADKVDRQGSNHPTVKPIDLIRYLVKLVCPIGGTVLDPFAGSGTTGDAALAEGRNAILVELGDDYIVDIQKRNAAKKDLFGRPVHTNRRRVFL